MFSLTGGRPSRVSGIDKKKKLRYVSNRRSATLRTYAGDTALPGGKVEPQDKTFEDTAVSLPLQAAH